LGCEVFKEKGCFAISSSSGGVHTPRQWATCTDRSRIGSPVKSYLTVTKSHVMVAPSGRRVAPSSRRGPRYWPTRTVSPAPMATVARLAGMFVPRTAEKTAAVSACPTADSAAVAISAASAAEISLTSISTGKVEIMFKENAFRINIFSSRSFEQENLSGLHVELTSLCRHDFGYRVPHNAVIGLFKLGLFS